jgi:hypothetical protein
MQKKVMTVIIMLTFCIGIVPLAFAVESGGKEHGGTAAKEHGVNAEVGKVEVKVPSADDIRAAMKAYVDKKSQDTGAFDILDPETGKARKLKFERVHERVGKTGSYYYSCADFSDTDSGENLDLDLDIEDKDAALTVVDVRIHKVNGKERYTYDENDNRIPLTAPKEETSKEHGGKMQAGKEHAGK